MEEITNAVVAHSGSQSGSGANDVVLDLLQKIMMLTGDQRQTLWGAWRAFDTQIDGAGMPAAPAQDVSYTEQLPNDELENWIVSLRAYSKRQRVAMLSESLEKADQAWEVERVQAEIAQITKGDPIFAIEVAVTKYAFAHPLLFLAGTVGILTLIYTLGKSIVMRIF